VHYGQLENREWDNLDRGHGYRPNVVWTVHTTEVKILSFRPLSSVIRCLTRKGLFLRCEWLVPTAILLANADKLHLNMLSGFSN